MYNKKKVPHHACHAAFAEGGAVGLPRFGVHAVHHLDGVLELLALDLVRQLGREPAIGRDYDLQLAHNTNLCFNMILCIFIFFREIGAENHFD